MKPGSSEFGLVVGLVLFVAVILIVVMVAGDPQSCTPAATCRGVQ